MWQSVVLHGFVSVDVEIFFNIVKIFFEFVIFPFSFPFFPFFRASKDGWRGSLATVAGCETLV